MLLWCLYICLPLASIPILWTNMTTLPVKSIHFKNLFIFILNQFFSEKSVIFEWVSFAISRWKIICVQSWPTISFSHFPSPPYTRIWSCFTLLFVVRQIGVGYFDFNALLWFSPQATSLWHRLPLMKIADTHYLRT